MAKENEVMPDVTINDLPGAVAVGTSVAPVATEDGSSTNKVTLSDIAALGGGPPAAHAASHASTGTDPISPANIGAASAAHVHAIATITGLQTTLDAKLESDVVQAGGGTAITNLVACTAAEYAAITTKDSNTIYFVR